MTVEAFSFIYEVILIQPIRAVWKGNSLSLSLVFIGIRKHYSEWKKHRPFTIFMLYRSGLFAVCSIARISSTKGLQLMIISVYKIVTNVYQCFSKPKKTSSNVLFCPKPKYIQFTVIDECRKRNIFTFKKLESENFDFGFYYLLSK